MNDVIQNYKSITVTPLPKQLTNIFSDLSALMILSANLYSLTFPLNLFYN